MSIIDDQIKALDKIVQEKHGGWGLADHMAEVTIKPFLRESMEKIQREMVECVSCKKEIKSKPKIMCKQCTDWYENL